MSFEQAHRLILEFEGGKSDDPRDPGGRTNLGVTQQTLDTFRKKNPSWGLPADVFDLNVGESGMIYKQGYWDEMRCDEMPGGIALMAFDCAVNQGSGRAKRLLQTSAKVTADGIIGPATLNAVKAADQEKLRAEFAAQRVMAYISTGRMATFGLGWMRRLMRVLQVAGSQ